MFAKIHQLNTYSSYQIRQGNWQDTQAVFERIYALNEQEYDKSILIYLMRGNVSIPVAGIKYLINNTGLKIVQIAIDYRESTMVRTQIMNLLILILIKLTVKSQANILTYPKENILIPLLIRNYVYENKETHNSLQMLSISKSETPNVDVPVNFKVNAAWQVKTKLRNEGVDYSFIDERVAA